MTIQKRSLVIGSIFAIAFVLYGAAKHYSPSLVFYVVEQSLIQKAPFGSDAVILHESFHTYIYSAPDKNSRMERLLRISQYLEKIQRLRFEDLSELLAVGKPGIFR